MKYKHLERYKVALETVSPVFIGSSDNLNKKELVFIPNEGMVLVPDLDKLIAALEAKRALEAFEQYLMNESNRKPLREFLQEQGIPVAANAPWVQYHLRCSSIEFRNINTLSRFIKDVQGRPYIPGASIKGAIRTALLYNRSSDKNIQSVKGAADYEIRTKRKQRECRDAEYPLRVLKLDQRERKEMDAVNDLLKCLEVSDSAPFGDNSLVVCKKLELTRDGDVNGTSDVVSRGKPAPPLYRECLRPGLKTHFYVTIDKSLAKDKLSVDVIKNALKQWQRVQNEYADRFDYGRIDLRGLDTAGIPIVLGGGVGFQSKSLLMKLKDDRDSTIHAVLDAQFNKKEKRYKNSPGDPAPYRMKLAQYNGSFYPMGRCSLTVEE